MRKPKKATLPHCPGETQAFHGRMDAQAAQKETREYQITRLEPPQRRSIRRMRPLLPLAAILLFAASLAAQQTAPVAITISVDDRLAPGDLAEVRYSIEN